MSRIQELIKEMCPNGVQYYVLDDIADTFIGLATSVTKYKEKEGIVLLHNSDIRQNKIILKSIEFISKDFADKNKGKYHRLNDIVTVHTGDVGTSAVISKEYVGSMGFTTLVTRIRNFNLINPHYLCYYFNSDICKRDIARVTISDRSNLNQKEFCKLRIPIPPLEVQEEIVKILDKFGELEAELEARKQQYEFWHAKLLEIDEVKEIRLDVLFDLKNGFTPSKANNEYWENGTIPWFRMEDIRENGRILNDSIQHVTVEATKGNIMPANSIIISTSATIGEHALITCESLSNQRFTYLMLKEDYKDVVDMKYIFYHCFLLDKYCLNNLNQGNFASIDMNAFKKYVFKIPSLEKQRKIASILDRFNDLTSSITIGLPAEIELRKKQYEYYRNRLLSFEVLNG